MGNVYEPCWTSLVIGGEERVLRLPLRQLVELQAECGAPITNILGRVLDQSYYADDCPQVLISGLIGGGLGPIQSRKLVEDLIRDKPLDIVWFMAAEIIRCCVKNYDTPAAGFADKRTTDVGYILWPEVIANAAVMSQPISIIADMTNWEYSALIQKWQERNAEASGEIEPPSVEWFREQQAMLKARGVPLN